MKKKTKQNSEKRMMIQKGIVAVALVIAMGLSALTNVANVGTPATVEAATLTSEEGFLYAVNEDENTVRILGYSDYPYEENEDGELVYAAIELYIPETINGKVVTAIGENAFYEKNGISKVVLPDTIERIENYAFYCVGGITINFPDSLTYIGEQAFRSVRFTDEIELPASLTHIGAYAFCECRGVKTLKLGSSITQIEQKAIDFLSVEEYVVAEENPVFTSLDGVLFNNDMTKLVKYPLAKEGEYVVPNTVTVIDARAFEETEVEKVFVPESLTDIGESAFSHSNISNINLPKELKKISAGMFSGCYNLKQIKLPDSVEKIDNYAFSGTSISSIVIPEKVTELGEGVFQSCDNLTNIEVQGNLISVGHGVLSETPWLEEQLKDSNYAILDDVLVGARALSGDIRIPDSVRVICRIPFWLISGNITSVTLPASVKYIHNEGLGLSNSSYNELKAIWVEEGNTEFVSDNGVLFDKNYTRILDIPYKYSGKLTIPKTVQELSWEEYQYDGLPNVNIIILENTDLLIGLTDVDSINRGVVIVDEQGNILKCGSDYSTALQNITYQIEEDGKITVTGVSQTAETINLVIPTFIEGKTVTGIAENAFRGYTNIASIKLPDSIVSIGDNAFENCVGVSKIYVYNNDMLNYFNQETVDAIGYNVTVYDASGAEYMKTLEFTSEASDYLYAKRSDGTIVVKQYLGTEENVVIPDEIDGMKVTAIGSDAFCLICHANCRGITSITLPDTLREIYSSAFCFIDVKEIMIPEGVTTIGDFAFSSGALESVTFPSTLREIGNNAFDFCKLKEIIIPDGLERIGSSAFANNSNVTSVRFPASVKSLGGREGLAFYNNPNLAEFNVDVDNEVYASMDDVLYSKDMKTLILYPQGKSGSAYRIPDGVTAVGEYAFSQNPHLEKITLSENLESIGADAFYNCGSLASVVIYDKVFEIGGSAFLGCADSDYTDLQFTITCYPSSYAYKYAQENGYEVDLLEAKEPITEEPTTEELTTEEPTTERPTTEVSTTGTLTTEAPTTEMLTTETPTTEQSTIDRPTSFNIKNKKKYKKSKKVKIKDADGIKTIKLNSKKIKIALGKKSFSFKLSKYKKYLKKKNKWNKIVITDVNGKKKTIKFRVK